MESEGSLTQNIKEFFKSIIRFIQNLASNIKKKFLELRYKEKSENLNDTVKEAMKKIDADPQLRSQRVEYFDCEEYQKNVAAFMKEVNIKFDKIISMSRQIEDEDEMQRILNEFNAEVDVLYKKYNLGEGDVYNVKDSLSNTIRKTYAQQKNYENATEQQIRNWETSIKDMESKVDSLYNKKDEETAGFSTLKAAISKFCGHIGNAINKIASYGPWYCIKILLAVGVIGSLAYAHTHTY
jgi:DNA mismatch repair ATPase MutS